MLRPLSFCFFFLRPIAVKPDSLWIASLPAGPRPFPQQQRQQWGGHSPGRRTCPRPLLRSEPNGSARRHPRCIVRRHRVRPPSQQLPCSFHDEACSRRSRTQRGPQGLCRRSLCGGCPPPRPAHARVQHPGYDGRLGGFGGFIDRKVGPGECAEGAPTGGGLYPEGMWYIVCTVHCHLTRKLPAGGGAASFPATPPAPPLVCSCSHEQDIAPPPVPGAPLQAAHRPPLSLPASAPITGAHCPAICPSSPPSFSHPLRSACRCVLSSGCPYMTALCGRLRCIRGGGCWQPAGRTGWLECGVC